MIDWDKEFPIASLTRADLKAAGFSEEDIEQLTDEDMKAIASKLEDVYRDNQFEIDLEIEVQALLESRRQQGSENSTSNG